MSFRIQKLDFKGVGRIYLYHGPDLAGRETLPWPLLQERHHIKKFDRAVLHIIYLTRNNCRLADRAAIRAIVRIKPA